MFILFLYIYSQFNNNIHHVFIFKFKKKINDLIERSTAIHPFKMQQSDLNAKTLLPF